jgi:hypothetical protein
MNERSAAVLLPLFACWHSFGAAALVTSFLGSMSDTVLADWTG